MMVIEQKSENLNGVSEFIVNYFKSTSDNLPNKFNSLLSQINLEEQIICSITKIEWECKEEIDFGDLSVADGWDFFTQPDKFLVIQNPIPDKKPLRRKKKKNNLPFENHHSIEEIGELFYSLAPPEIKKKFLDLAKKLSSELDHLSLSGKFESPSKIWKEKTEKKTILKKKNK